jgi:hypothetical protein
MTGSPTARCSGERRVNFQRTAEEGARGVLSLLPPMPDNAMAWAHVMLGSVPVVLGSVPVVPLVPVMAGTLV